MIAPISEYADVILAISIMVIAYALLVQMFLALGGDLLRAEEP